MAGNSGLQRLGRKNRNAFFEGTNEIHGPQPPLKIPECTNNCTVQKYKVVKIKNVELR